MPRGDTAAPNERLMRRLPRSRHPRLRAVVAAIALLGGAGASVPTDAQASPESLGTLEVGESVFWDGSFPFSLDPGDLVWEIELGRRGELFRVGFDIGSIDTTAMMVRVIDPGGVRHEGTAVDDAALSYSVEVLADDPAPGTWTVELDPGGVCGKEFLADPTDCPGVEWRMRASLEAVAPARGNVLLLPNLRVEPPFAFDRRSAFRCKPEESAESGQTTCLRFSFGPQNAGTGPFDLRLAPLDLRAPDLSGEVTQVIRRRDGTRAPFERPAGTYQFHLAHRHFHVDDYADVALYRVTDAQAGTMERNGDGHKVGFCMVDLKIVDWERFYQGARRETGSSLEACRDTDGATMGITQGWADIYEHNLQGNYVDFTGRDDGRYVVRVVIDPHDVYLEGDERDNSGYAYVQVMGTGSLQGPVAVLLERGRGTDPWDPAKVVYPNLVGPDNF